MQEWNLKRTKQCKKCLGKVSTNPLDILNGYSVEKHQKLSKTISDNSGNIYSISELKIMACHESGSDPEHCVGWLYNQIGVGNNIGLRISLRFCKNASDITVCGEQHKRFEDTLPY